VASVEVVLGDRRLGSMHRVCRTLDVHPGVLVPTPPWYNETTR
jgi:hypothetical protein